MFLMKCKDRGFCSSVSQVSTEIKDSPNLWSTWRSESSEILQVHHQCQEGNELYLPKRMPSGWLDLVSLYRVGVALNSQLAAVLSQQHREISSGNLDQRKILFYRPIAVNLPSYILVLGRLGLILSEEQKILMGNRKQKFSDSFPYLMSLYPHCYSLYNNHSVSLVCLLSCLLVCFRWGTRNLKGLFLPSRSPGLTQ